MATHSTRIERALRDAQMSRQQTHSILFTGIGIIGFVNETVFHQLLQWHTFYWATDEHGRILSDGMFHLFSTLLLLSVIFVIIGFQRF